MPGMIERALELAATGQYAGMAGLKDALRGEGFTHVDLEILRGAATRKQLLDIIRAAKRGTK